MLGAVAAMGATGVLAATGNGSSAGASAGALATSPLASPVAALVRAEVKGAGAGTLVMPSARITRRWTGALHPWRRGEINKAYWSQYARYRNVPTDWTGSNATCRPGYTSWRSRHATKSSINFARSLNGLAPIWFGTTMNHNAQRTALLMSANTTLSHYPTIDWRCYSLTGDRLAAKSNLALALPDISSGRIVDMYMDDRGSENVAAGHRRWLLYPFTTRMGNGSTDTANALQVVGPTNAWRPNPRWTSWPSTGYFPAPLEPLGRWSFSSGVRSEDFSHSVVRVWHNGTRLYPRRYAVHNGYGMPTVVWQMPRETSRVGTYKVTIARITRPGLGRYFSHTYYVKIFRPWR